MPHLLPHDRLIAEGSAALSDAELLAVIMLTGSATETALQLAERILSASNGIRRLEGLDAAHLQQFDGLSSIKAAQISAVFELSKRLTSGSVTRVQIETAADAARCVADMATLMQENVRAILLDSSSRMIAAPTVYIGTVSAAVVRAAEVFRDAVLHNSPALILAHNHPSGDPTPSPEDVELTRTLVHAGYLLDIRVLDHIIIGRDGWVSLREQGFLP